MEIVKVFEGSNITFEQKNGKLMVNATQMAKPFNKNCSEWLRLPSSIEFLTEFEAMGKSHRSDLVQTINGVGTWLSEDIAIEFARWLSPKFAIWCNTQIKELLTNGVVLLKPKTRRELAEENLALIIEIEEKDKLLLEQKPKVEFYDEVTESADTCDMAKVAKLLNMGIGRNNLFELLRNEGILRQNNEPMQRYVDNGWFRVVESKWLNNNGELRICFKTVVFQKGIDGIRKIIQSKKNGTKKDISRS